MRPRDVFMVIAAIMIILSYAKAKLGGCRHCLDSEIVKIIPSLLSCCLRSENQKCGKAAHCKPGLTCRYPYRLAPSGICKAPAGRPCKVNGSVYNHSSTFKIDCRTECYCENGIYGCSTLCPKEKMIPKDVCESPELVDVPSQCCREWMCKPMKLEETKLCSISTTPWEACSSHCGGGISYRESNTNPQCEMTKEARFCQLQSCRGMHNAIESNRGKHKLRKNRSCRATFRNPSSHLRIGPCFSVRAFHPRQCGTCVSPGVCCKPVRTTTMKVEVKCGSLLVDENTNDIHKTLLEYIIPGYDIWDTEDAKRYSIETAIKNHQKDRYKRNSDYDEVKHSDPYDDENNVHFVNIEWIIKCECKKEFCEKAEAGKTNVANYKKEEERQHQHNMFQANEFIPKDILKDSDISFVEGFGIGVDDFVSHRVHRTDEDKDEEY